MMCWGALYATLIRQLGTSVGVRLFIPHTPSIVALLSVASVVRVFIISFVS